MTIGTRGHPKVSLNGRFWPEPLLLAKKAWESLPEFALAYAAAKCGIGGAGWPRNSIYGLITYMYLRETTGKRRVFRNSGQAVMPHRTPQVKWDRVPVSSEVRSTSYGIAHLQDRRIADCQPAIFQFRGPFGIYMVMYWPLATAFSANDICSHEVSEGDAFVAFLGLLQVS